MMTAIEMMKYSLGVMLVAVLVLGLILWAALSGKYVRSRSAQETEPGTKEKTRIYCCILTEREALPR